MEDEEDGRCTATHLESIIGQLLKFHFQIEVKLVEFPYYQNERILQHGQL